MKKFVPAILIATLFLCSCNATPTDTITSVPTTTITEATTTETTVSTKATKIIGMWSFDNTTYEFKSDLTGNYYVDGEITLSFYYEAFDDGSVAIISTAEDKSMQAYTFTIVDDKLTLADSFGNSVEYTKIAEPAAETSETSEETT